MNATAGSDTRPTASELGSKNAACPEQAAEDAGLRYVTDAMPGISRQRRGRGFSYQHPEGFTIRDKPELERIKALAIPPAWTDVWICPQTNGHLQATGRDAKGRKQYRYHPDWRTVRDQTKFERMVAFGEALPVIREHVHQDLGRAGLPREKVLGTIVRLLDTTLIRVGNVEYARDNESFGLTTLRDRHVDISGAHLEFRFRGKSGKEHVVDLHDRRLANVVRRCRDIPGYELFQYLDPDGQRHSVDSADVNDYLRQITGADFTAKDFRTWAGSVLAYEQLMQHRAIPQEPPSEHDVVHAVKAVAERLGNTPAICRRCYIHPAIIDGYLAAALPAATEGDEPSDIPEHGLRAAEQIVLDVLRQHE